MSSVSTGTREIGRHAVRKELARVAFDRFCFSGFNDVTFADLAKIAGVSRSTFLRYFSTKEDVVLFVFDPIGESIAEEVASAGGQTNWGRLQGALKAAAGELVVDVANLATILNLIEQTPALRTRLAEKTRSWRPSIVEALAAPSGKTSVEAEVQVAAALECLWITLDRWAAKGGKADINPLLDEAFAALAGAPSPALEATGRL
jgi:AcrR family transcriptional regulator